MNVTLAIPTYNRADWLGRTLDSIARLVIPSGAHVEVIVVDNASTDDTPNTVTGRIHTFPLPLRSVREERQGLCHARNRALQEAAGSYVVFFDDDVLVAEDWLLGFQAALSRFSADAVVGPVVPLFETPPPSYFSPMALDSVTSAYSRKGEQAMLLPAETAHQLPGCNFAVRRDLALEIGGFDSRLDRIGRGMVGHGDWEFGYALVRASGRVAYEPRCRVQHWVGAPKLSPASLRARWYGFGAAERFLAVRHGKKVPRAASFKSAARAVRYLARSVAAQLLGHRAAAFEYQLKACREWGYARGLPHAAEASHPGIS